MDKGLLKYTCTDCNSVFYLRKTDVEKNTSAEGVVCPFCVTYGENITVDAAEYETREIPKAVDFKVGDRVRHRDKPYYGTGVVEEISKSGKSVYVRWGDDWDRRRLIEHPYGGYFRPDKLVRIP